MKKCLMFIFCLLFIVISCCGKKSESTNSTTRGSNSIASSISSSTLSKNSIKQKGPTDPTFLYFPNSDTGNSTQPKASNTPACKTSSNQLPNSSSTSESSLSNDSLSYDSDFTDNSNFDDDPDFSNKSDFSDEIDSTDSNFISLSSSSVSSNSSFTSFAKADTFSVGDKIILVSDDIVSGKTHSLVFKHYHSNNNSEPSEIIIKVTESKYTDDYCETFDGQGTLLGTINGKKLYIYLDNDSYPNKTFIGIFVGDNEKCHKSKSCVYYGSLNVLKLYSYQFENNNID